MFQNRQEAELETMEQFLDFSLETRTDVMKRPNEIDQLTAMCQRAQKFENVINNVRPKLIRTTNDILVKLCLSHVEEIDESEDLKPVIDYQSRIVAYRSKLDVKFEKLDQLFADYVDMKVPFLASYGICYISEGQRIQQQIEEICALVLDICDIMKKWVNDDKTYASRLWDEVISANGQRGRIIQEIKKHVRRRDDLAHSLKVNKNHSCLAF